MTEKLQQIMKDEILKLPKVRQDAINSFNWVKATEEIGKKFLLEDDEISNLEAETGLMLLGGVDTDSYKNNIENNVGTTTEEAHMIYAEALEKIFTPIANAIESSLQNSSKTPSWSQTINFIVSGGDYSFFVGEDTANTAPQNINVAGKFTI